MYQYGRYTVLIGQQDSKLVYTLIHWPEEKQLLGKVYTREDDIEVFAREGVFLLNIIEVMHKCK